MGAIVHAMGAVVYGIYALEAIVCVLSSTGFVYAIDLVIVCAIHATGAVVYAIHVKEDSVYAIHVTEGFAGVIHATDGSAYVTGAVIFATGLFC